MGVSVRKKGNSWFIDIRLRSGERAAKKCVDEEHARETQKAVLTRIASGDFDISLLKKKRDVETQTKASQTLGEFWDKTMLPLAQASQAPATAARAETSFRLHIRPLLGDTPINLITRDSAKELIVAVLSKSATKRTQNVDEPERKLSKDSVRLVVATLRSTLNEAVERKLITTNPATKLGKYYREAGTVREQVDPFTVEEIPILLTATHTHYGFENYVVMLTLFHTGLRISELVGLQWPDLDFRGRFITVRRQYKDGKITRTKTKKIRKVDMSDDLFNDLQALKKRRQAECLARGKNEIPDWVFLSPGKIVWSEGTKRRGGRKPIGRKEGQPLDAKNFRNRIFLKACDKANVRRRRLHDTRHTFASILIMNGESLAYVKDQLGHSSIKMTVDIYGHWIPGSNRQAVNKLPSLRTTANMRSAASGSS